MEKPAEVDSRRVFLFEEVSNMALMTSCRQNNYTGHKGNNNPPA